MWPFKRKKANREPQRSGLPCSYCQSTQTIVRAFYGSDQPNYVRTWRGQRYLTCRCLNCGRDFYADEPPGGLADGAMTDGANIDDEEELRAAEDEVKRQVEDDGDRRCR